MGIGAQAARSVPWLFQAGAFPATVLAKRRNTALDWAFYDIRNLTDAEYALLVAETTREGSILIVWPSGAKGEIGVRKHADHAELRAQPGAMLRRFAIAGVGSSDVGAAAFARTVADRYDEPVGAIVAGYGVADLLAEAAGGWFVLGAANRMMRAWQDTIGATEALGRELRDHPAGLTEAQSASAARKVAGLNDSDTLLRLLLDADRTIASLAGHSKGALSIAFALEAVALIGDPAAIDRARPMRITTAGAVVALPAGYDNVGQYLGALDWFGAINSEPDVPRTPVPMAWHHLNTLIPAHMDFARVLAGEPD